MIALTIDDGPDTATTSEILALLSRYQARATFFVIGERVAGNEALVQQMLVEGHELGNHLCEDRPSIRLSPRAFADDLQRAEAILAPFAKPRWLRPASGWYSPTMVRVAADQGYRVALGSLFPFDTHIASARFAAAYLAMHAYPGAIIVLHDSGAWGQRTLATLARLLPVLQAQGYRLVTLSELLG